MNVIVRIGAVWIRALAYRTVGLAQGGKSVRVRSRYDASKKFVKIENFRKIVAENHYPRLLQLFVTVHLFRQMRGNCARSTENGGLLTNLHKFKKSW